MCTHPASLTSCTWSASKLFKSAFKTHPDFDHGSRCCVLSPTNDCTSFPVSPACRRPPRRLQPSVAQQTAVLGKREPRRATAQRNAPRWLACSRSKGSFLDGPSHPPAASDSSLSLSSLLTPLLGVSGTCQVQSHLKATSLVIPPAWNVLPDARRLQSTRTCSFTQMSPPHFHPRPQFFPGFFLVSYHHLSYSVCLRLCTFFIIVFLIMRGDLLSICPVLYLQHPVSGT